MNMTPIMPLVTQAEAAKKALVVIEKRVELTAMSERERWDAEALASRMRVYLVNAENIK